MKTEMADIRKIIEAMDSEIVATGKEFLTPTEANAMLEQKGLLKDRPQRPGLYLRRLLRKGKIPHAFQVEGKGSAWRIPHSKSNSSEETREDNGGWRSEITSLLWPSALAFCSKLASLLWSILPQIFVDFLVIFAMYIVSSLLVKASEAISITLWSTGQNPFYASIISLQGQPITPASFLKFFIQLWLVVSLTMNLVVNTYHLIRMDYQSSEDAE